MFGAPSWIAIFMGNPVFPESYDPAVDGFDVNYLKRSFDEIHNSLQGAASGVLTHAAFIEQNCQVQG